MFSYRRRAAVVAALFAVVLLSTPALGAQWQSGFTSSGTDATAHSESCTDNGNGTSACTSIRISVFEGTSRDLATQTVRSERVCYTEIIYTMDNATGETIESTSRHGCAFDTGTVSVDQFDSVTLAPTEIPVIVSVCDADSCQPEEPAGTVAVAGTWTGIEPISSQNIRSRSDDGSCVFVESHKGTFRLAQFTGTIDGVPFVADTADMAQGTSTFRSTC